VYIMQPHEEIILQRMMMPDPMSCEISGMYYKGSARYDRSKGSVILESTGQIDFHTYFNLIPARHFSEFLGVNFIDIFCTFVGKAEFLLYANDIGHAEPRLISSSVLSSDNFNDQSLFDVVDISSITGYMYLVVNTHTTYFELRSVDVGCKERKIPTALGIVICTFKREKFVRRTCESICSSFDDFPSDFSNTDLYVINNDSESTLSLPENNKLHHLKNLNLGGAGGFTRGIIESIDAGKDYVLLCDDDIVVPSEVIRRAVVVLSLLKDPSMGLHGAMMELEFKSVLHEMGEFFDENKRLHVNMNYGLPMTDTASVKRVTYDSFGNSKSANMFGWWFTAFPVSLIKKIGLPMPFFVSGDDLEYSLRAVNYDYKSYISPSISVWHPSHMTQHAPMRTYFITRNRLALLSLHTNRNNVLRMVKLMFKEALHMALTKRYATCDAICAGVEDFLRGDEWYSEDLSNWKGSVRWPKRENVLSFYVDAWHNPLAPIYELRKESLINAVIRKITFNGHILSGLFHSRAEHPSSFNHKCIPDGVAPIGKKILRISFSSSSVFFYDQRSQVGFRVEHNNWMFWRAYYRLLLLRLSFRLKFFKAFNGYGASFQHKSSIEWWRKRLGI